jgi:hypothetical protein
MGGGKGIEVGTIDANLDLLHDLISRTCYGQKNEPNLIASKHYFHVTKYVPSLELHPQKILPISKQTNKECSFFLLKTLHLQ